MPRDLMTECEKRTLFKDKATGVKKWSWKHVRVADVYGEVLPSDIRCAHCRGAVRLHRQKVENGPQDHVEHRLRQDSEGCRAGHYFQGEHRESSAPVK